MKKNPLQSWRIIEEHYYERFRLFSAKRSTRINPKTGEPFNFFLMEGLDWTNVILLTDQEEVVLVEQFRHGADIVTTELPGGAVERGEAPIDAAAREVLEETGYSPRDLKHLGTTYANPAMQSMRLHIFIGRTEINSQQLQQLDEEEQIHVIVKPIAELIEDLRTGKVQHALTAAALGMYLASTLQPYKIHTTR